MMAQVKQHESLTDRLPAVRGSLVPNADLSNMIWFRTGGPAEVLFKPADLDDLQQFLKNLPADIPVFMVGVGSNLLVRDGGVDGVVIKLGKPFAHINIDGCKVTAGAGAIDITVAHKSAEAGIGGLEFLRGIPGTIGGAIKMNAGAYGREVADALTQVTIITRQGEVKTLSHNDCDFRYRKSAIGDDMIVVEATFEGTKEDSHVVIERMEAINKAREESQPLRTKTGGSTFKNIVGNDDGEKAPISAWQLVDQAGCRGLSVGDAQVSEKHCNFLINHGGASAHDLETLGELVREKVLDKTGHQLHWEIKRVGKFVNGREVEVKVGIKS